MSKFVVILCYQEKILSYFHHKLHKVSYTKRNPAIQQVKAHHFLNFDTSSLHKVSTLFENFFHNN